MVVLFAVAVGNELATVLLVVLLYGVPLGMIEENSLDTPLLITVLLLTETLATLLTDNEAVEVVLVLLVPVVIADVEEDRSVEGSETDEVVSEEVVTLRESDEVLVESDVNKEREDDLDEEREEVFEEVIEELVVTDFPWIQSQSPSRSATENFSKGDEALGLILWSAL